MKSMPGWLWSPARPDVPWRLCSDWRVKHGPAPWLALEPDPSEGPCCLVLDKDGPSPRDQLRSYERLGPLVCSYPGPTGGLSVCRLKVAVGGLVRYSSIAGAYGAPIHSSIHNVVEWLCDALHLRHDDLRVVQESAGKRLRQVLLQITDEGFRSPQWRELAPGQDLALLGPSLREGHG